MTIVKQPSSELAKAQRVTVVSALVNIIVSIAKVWVGVLGHSNALIADGIHSLSDLLTDVLVWFVNRISFSGADAEHPYGHGRFEALGTALLGAILIFIAGGLALENMRILLGHAVVPVPTWPVLLVALLSIFIKEGLYRYLVKVGKDLNSQLLIANAWHSRTDGFSAIFVLVGVGVAMLGVPWLDQVVALIICGYMAWIGWKFCLQSAKELVDSHALTHKQQMEIKQLIKKVNGVKDVHELRSRHMGPMTSLDVHVEVLPFISVSEGHHIAEWVMKVLQEHQPNLADITVHIDAEPDVYEGQLDQPLLPLRDEILKILAVRWQDIQPTPELSSALLHFHQNKVSIDLFYAAESFKKEHPQLTSYQAQLSQAVLDIVWMHRVRVWLAVE